jgi:hypothetical protein
LIGCLAACCEVLHSALDILNTTAGEIAAYKQAAENVLVGTQNLISVNPPAPSHDALQQEIDQYTAVIELADAALAAIAEVQEAFGDLADGGYPHLS